jgi:hypothetical protein
VFGLNDTNKVLDVEWVPVWAEAGALKHGAALRISRERSTDYALFAEPIDERHRSWRVGELQTDARMMCWRVDGHALADILAMADGTFARLGSTAVTSHQTATRNRVCVASPAS